MSFARGGETAGGKRFITESIIPISNASRAERYLSRLNNGRSSASVIPVHAHMFRMSISFCATRLAALSVMSWICGDGREEEEERRRMVGGKDEEMEIEERAEWERSGAEWGGGEEPLVRHSRCC